MTAAETIARLTAERDALRAKHAPIRELAARLLAETEGHTPGPWLYRPLSRYMDWGSVVVGSTDYGFFHICQARDPDRVDDDILAKYRASGIDPWGENARLIAAAPDMRAAIIAAGGEE